MQISATLIALVLLICSFVWAAFVERSVSSSIFALWSIAISVLGNIGSFG